VPQCYPVTAHSFTAACWSQPVSVFLQCVGSIPVADLQRKLSAVEAAKLEIEARLDTANHALERLSSFVSIRGSDLQRPRCWIENEVIAILRPASGGPSGHDNFRCETCKKRVQFADLSRVTCLQRTELRRNPLEHKSGEERR
jgi:hypothetical protein